MLQLRDYQTDLIARARAAMQQGTRSLILQAPTGSGKTILTAWMLKTAAEKSGRSWFIVHRRELIKQSLFAFADVGITPGLIAAGFPADPRQPIQLCSVQTLRRRWPRCAPPSLIVWDECAHIAARGWAEIRVAFPTAYHIGLTATPERLDGKGLSAYFSTLITGPSVTELTAQGYLAPYRLYAPPGIDTAGLHTRMGDYANDELTRAADRPTITGDVIAHYRKHAEGTRALVFCVSIQHSQHVAAQFVAAGYHAVHVDGDTPSMDRDGALHAFSRGSIRIITSVDLFGEGLDVPALETVILLRPTMSLSLYLQQVGRSLRPAPGKTAIILDHAGNCVRHGLPDDPRDWSLDGRKWREAAKDAAPSVRLCPACFAAMPSGATSCTFCEFVFEVQPREVAHVDGELEQVDPATFRRQQRREQGRCKTLDDLIALGTQRGYRYPKRWACIVHAARLHRQRAGAPTEVLKLANLEASYTS